LNDFHFIRDTADYSNYLDETGYEILGDSFGKSWREYYSDDLRERVIVKNIKGRGFPDYEEVIEATVPKLPKGITKENLESYVTIEFFDRLFWDNVQVEVDYIADEFPNFVVVGRSGGYWGMKIDYIHDYLLLDEKKIGKMAEDILKNIEKLINEGELVQPYTWGGDAIEVDDFFADDLTYIYSDVIAEVVADTILEDLDFADVVFVSAKAKAEFEELDKVIENTIEYYEDPNTWVETILANQYWEEG
jgi:hypothetical protein